MYNENRIKNVIWRRVTVLVEDQSRSIIEPSFFSNKIAIDVIFSCKRSEWRGGSKEKRSQNKLDSDGNQVHLSDVIKRWCDWLWKQAISVFGRTNFEIQPSPERTSHPIYLEPKLRGGSNPPALDDGVFKAGEEITQREPKFTFWNIRPLSSPSILHSPFRPPFRGRINDYISSEDLPSGKVFNGPAKFSMCRKLLLVAFWGGF